ARGHVRRAASADSTIARDTLAGPGRGVFPYTPSMHSASSWRPPAILLAALCALGAASACGGGGGGEGGKGSGAGSGVGTGGPLPPAPSCTAAAKGTATTQKPELLFKLADRYEEGWLSSPAVADLDGDGKNEIIVVREGLVVVWNADGSPRWRFDTGAGRIWASPVVADFRDDSKLEIAVAARDQVFLLDSDGKLLSGFP